MKKVKQFLFGLSVAAFVACCGALVASCSFSIGISNSKNSGTSNSSTPSNSVSSADSATPSNSTTPTTPTTPTTSTSPTSDASSTGDTSNSEQTETEHVHSWGEWTLSREATCTTEGKEIRVCQTDGTHTETRSIEMTEHTAGEWTIVKEATCTQGGSQEKQCTVCNTVLETETLTAKGHNYIDGICENCGAVNPDYCTEGVALTGTIESGGEMKFSVTGYTGESERVIIPQNYNGFPVTSIADNALKGKQITSLIIPDSVTTIGVSAFQDCTKLENVIIGNGVETIGKYAFYNCSGLTNVKLSEGIVDIQERAFAHCESLTSFVIPDSTTTIGEAAFKGCTSLTSLTIGKGVTLINNYAFYNCTALTKIQYNATEAATVGSNESNISFAGNYIFYNAGLSADGIEVRIGANVTEIPVYLFCPTFLSTSHEPKIINVIFEEGSECKQISIGAFEQCKYLESINLPKSLEVLAEASMKKCIALQELVIPESVTVIEKRVFEECTGFKTMKLPDNATTIGVEAFYGCTGLTSIEIPDKVKTIGEYAFYGCTSLQNVTIGKGVTVINNYAFYNCTALTKIQYNATECAVVGTNEENNPYAGNYIFYNAGYSTDGITLTIGANVQKISDYFFCPTVKDDTHGPKIINVIFEEGSECKEIARGAFERCVYLETINLPEGLETIGKFAFKNCFGLKEITIPDNVTTIGLDAFNGCTSMQSLTIGKGVEVINNAAFYNCTALTKIQYNATEAATVGTKELGYAYAGNYIFYCAGLSADGIEVTIGKNVQVIPEYLFCPTNKDVTHGTKIVSVKFEEGSECKVLKWAAFDRCTYLQSIDLPEGLETIGEYAFYREYSLQEIVIPNSVTTIGEGAFKYCSALKEIVIPDNVTTIGVEAFNGCTSLQSVTIGKGVKTIGDNAFYNCSNLQYIYCKAESKPSGWSSKWKDSCNATVYWGGSWEYDENGEPKVKS